MERRRRYAGVMGRVVNWITYVFAAYLILYLSGAFHWMRIYIYEGSHVAVLLAFIFLFTFLKFPAYKNAPRDKLPWYDILFIILSLVGTLHIAANAATIVTEQKAANIFEQALCLITVAMVLEAARRAVSPILSLLGLLFFLYPFVADKMPGLLLRPAWGLERIATVQYLYPTGIFGSIMYMLATLIVAFIIFGAFLQASGAGANFVDLALSVAGRFRGGPAKVAILGSCLFGTINGSALANIATIGTVTIPLMKSAGYKPTFAAGVEAVASTGGPMTPPVMGASIFIMMDFLGVSYVTLMLIAAVPAFLYYLGLFIMVDHEAVKNGLKGLPREQVPPLRTSLINSWFCLVPLLVVVYLLVALHYSPATAAMAAIASLILASFFKKGAAMGPKKILTAMAGSSTGLPEVGSAVGVAGILMGAFSITGLGLTISQELVALAGSNIYVLIAIVAIACIVFGMGLTGIAVYLLAAIFLAPALVTMGVKPIAAHFFVLWMAHSAMITPPVCPSAYLAGAIAGAPLMATGWQACRLGIVVYIMSVAWVQDPALLLIGEPMHIAQALATAIVGVYFMSCGVSGRMLRPAGWLERVLFLCGGMLLMIPGNLVDIIGLAAVTPPALWQVLGTRVAAAKVGISEPR